MGADDHDHVNEDEDKNIYDDGDDHDHDPVHVHVNVRAVAHVVPVAFEEAIYAAARVVVGDAALATGPLVRAIVDRSHRYTSDRDRLARPQDRTADLAARAVFFTIADAMKIAIPLRELAGRNALPARRPIRVVDAGAGCGAMVLGLVSTLPDLAIEAVAIDRDSDALAIAAGAFKQFANTKLTTRTGDVARGAIPEADLIVMGSVLNELTPDVALALVERSLASLSDDGAVVVIEPALRDTSRALHAIRDAVIANGTGHVFAPCTRRTAPCPALADPTDWCHEDRALELPPRAHELARLTHLRDSGMKFAYLVLRKQALDLVAAGDAAWRIVRAPRSPKGKHELVGCSARAHMTLRLLKRNRSDGNREIEAAARGDVVTVDGPLPTDVSDERIEIGIDTVVRCASCATR